MWFSVEVTPSDGTITGGEFTSGGVKVASIVPTVIALPTVTSVSIAADNPSAATTPTATPQGTDPEGVPLTFTYQWLQDGSPIVGATGATLDLTPLTILPGDTFTVEVTPSDGTLTGNLFTSAGANIVSINPVIVLDLPPVVEAVSITADNADAATTLTAAPTQTDPQGLPMTFTYQWLQQARRLPARPGRRST